jgi:hypothetical protein
MLEVKLKQRSTNGRARVGSAPLNKFSGYQINFEISQKFNSSKLKKALKTMFDLKIVHKVVILSEMKIFC